MHLLACLTAGALVLPPQCANIIAHFHCKVNTPTGVFKGAMGRVYRRFLLQAGTVNTPMHRGVFNRITGEGGTGVYC